MKKTIKKIFHFLGFELNRSSVYTNSKIGLIKTLNKFNIDLVFDIGANRGQFGSELREIGYSGKIISFEPLPTAYALLVEKAIHDGDWIVEERMALGNEEGEAELYVASNSASSSLLKIGKEHLSASPHITVVGTDSTLVKKLDSVTEKYNTFSHNCFVKIDTQGFENQVIEGGKDTIMKSKLVQLELSLTPLYDGQDDYLMIIEKMRFLGFEIWSIDPMFFDTTSGRLLQVDAIFYKNK